MGRTQLQDAVPMTLGQEFEAYAAILAEEVDRLEQNCRNMVYNSIGLVTALNPYLGYEVSQAKALRNCVFLKVAVSKLKF
jgi:aspartate ammonia-lyase